MGRVAVIGGASGLLLAALYLQGCSGDWDDICEGLRVPECVSKFEELPADKKEDCKHVSELQQCIARHWGCGCNVANESMSMTEYVKEAYGNTTKGHCRWMECLDETKCDERNERHARRCVKTYEEDGEPKDCERIEELEQCLRTSGCCFQGQYEGHSFDHYVRKRYEESDDDECKESHNGLICSLL